MLLDIQCIINVECNIYDYKGAAVISFPLDNFNFRSVGTPNYLSLKPVGEAEVMGSVSVACYALFEKMLTLAQLIIVNDF